jgi:hypothetical protein
MFKLALPLSLAAALLAAETVAVPSVTPVTGPGAPYPGLQRVPEGTALADYKYVAQEYFVSGTAAGQPYTTRILVRRPEDASKFTGIVVAEPMHSSGNSWMFFFTRIYVMSRGHVSVEIDPQKAPTESVVVASNPERYSKISIASNNQANEIIAQVGALLKANLPNGPLPGMQVRRVFLMGTSQSAGQVRGYFPTHAALRLANGAPIYDGFLPTSNGGQPIQSLDVPIIQIPTQTEVNSGASNRNAYRRPDGDAPGDQFRLYEIAGMPHNDSRENPTYNPDPCKQPVTQFPVGAMMAMALHNLIEWADKGKTPPKAERIKMDYDTSNDGSPLALDAYGNAQGGVRSVYLDVPVAKYGVPNSADPKPGTRNDFFCSIAGYETPLSREQLKSLYNSSQEYREKVDQRLQQLIKEGWFLPEYSSQVTGDAAKVTIP